MKNVKTFRNVDQGTTYLLYIGDNRIQLPFQFHIIEIFSDIFTS